MADVKFSELSTLAASDVASADVIAIVDTSETTSKKLSIDNLFGAVPVNLSITDVTQSTSNTTGSITTTGGIGVSKDAYVGGVLNVFGNTVLNGANTNIIATTLDIDANVVIHSTLTVNSTTALIGTTLPLHFRDTGLSLSSPTNGTLDIAADTILEITAPTMNVVSTTVDFDANVTIHSTFSANSTAALMGTTLPLYFRDTGLSLSSPTDGTLDLAADTILEITAPTMNVISTTVDFDANVTIHSTFSANSTAALMGTTLPLYFRDTGLSLSSPTNGTLDIAADTILEITAPTTNVIATTAVTIHTPAISANGTVTIGADGTGYDVIFYTATSGNRWWIDEDADTMYANVTSVFGGNITVGVDGTGHDVTFYGDTASSQMLWDQSDDQMEFGNSFISMLSLIHI